MLAVSAVSNLRADCAALNRHVFAGIGAEQSITLLPLGRLHASDASGQPHRCDAGALLAICWGGEIWVIEVSDQAGCRICFRNWLLAGDAAQTDLLAGDVDPAICPLGIGLLASAEITLIQARKAVVGNRLWQAVRVDADHGQVVLHTYARHPECGVCRAAENHCSPAIPVPLAAMMAATGRRTADLAQLANGLRPYVFDTRLGLVRNTFRPDAPLLQSVSIAPLFPFTTPSFTESGYGRSGEPLRDSDIALFEAIERFAAMKPRGALQVIRDCRANLGEVAFDPATLIPHVDAAFAPGRMERYSSATVYDWIWAYSAQQQRQILIPQQLAYYGQFGEEPCGGRFVHETSSGSAIGGSVEEAMLYGLTEAVERDAFLVSWYGHRRCPTILPSSVADGLLNPLLARLAAQGLELVIQSVAVDLPVHVFAVRILNRTAEQDRAWYVAAGAHLNPLEALQSAVNEVTSMVRSSPEDHARAQTERGRYLIDRPDDVRTMADHESLCWPAETIDRFGFATGDAPITWAAYLEGMQADWPCPTNLAALIEAIARRCGDVIFADLGYRELRSAGVHCVKAICTGLLPITFGHQHRRIDWARVAQNSDIEVERLQSPELLRPHTFP